MSANITKKLAGKVALVTGGSRGIGAAIVKRLATDGADVTFSYAASADKANALLRELEDQGVKIAAFRADQADAVQVTQLVKSVVEKFGRLDILVNNAGVAVTGAVNDPAYDTSKFDRLFAINVGGVASAVRAAAPFLGEGGRIISIGSGPWHKRAVARHRRLCREQGGRCPLHSWLGTRSGLPGNHGQRSPTRPDQHGYESRRRGSLGNPEGRHCPRLLRKA